MGCVETIEKKVCVQAKVRVVPEAEAGEVELVCVGEPKREPCPDTVCRECDFMISQMMCLRIPIRFLADADVVEQGIVCENKDHGCAPHPCDESIRSKGPMFQRRYVKGLLETKPGRSFAENIRVTYQMNS